MKSFGIEDIQAALQKGWDRVYSTRNTCGAVIQCQAQEIVKMLDRAAGRHFEDETGFWSAGTRETVSVRKPSYDFWGIHEKPKTVEPIELEVRLDTRQTEAALKRLSDLANSTTQAVAGLFKREDYRREGWNDLKAVLIRQLNEKISWDGANHYLPHKQVTSIYFTPAELEAFRDFIATQQFDPTKP